MGRRKLIINAVFLGLILCAAGDEQNDSADLLVTQVLQGRLFGSSNSFDVSRRILADRQGALYIVGETTPAKSNEKGWGNADASEKTGSRDVFLAKVSPSGNLAWVKRTGSPKNEFLKDAKLAGNAIYLCGSTDGHFGNTSLGRSDSFIMKYTVDGDKAWRRPVQFGSAGHDSCNTIVVDPKSNRLYVAGTTKGKIFGRSKPTNGTAHMYTAAFEILDDGEVGLKLLRGRQRGEYGISSPGSIAFAKNRILVLSTYSGLGAHSKKMTTYLSTFEADALRMHKLQAIKTSSEGTFEGVRMVADNVTGDVYIVGRTTRNSGRPIYHALKFNPSANDGNGSVVWATKLGTASQKLKLEHQSPSIVIDVPKEMVYVAGVEDGVFYSVTDDRASIIMAPFYKLRMLSGQARQRWHRTIIVPTNKEELTDIALDANNDVVYTGVWSGDKKLKSNALIGAFGSSRPLSRLPSSLPLTSSAAVVYAAADGDEARVKMGEKKKVLMYVLIGCGAVGVMATAMFLYALRSSRRTVDIDEARFAAAATNMEELRRQIAESHREAAEAQAETRGFVVGGSAGPK